MPKVICCMPSFRFLSPFLFTISLVKLAPDSVSVAVCLTYQKAVQLENENKQKSRENIVQHKVVMRELIIDLLCSVLYCAMHKQMKNIERYELANTQTQHAVYSNTIPDWRMANIMFLI